MTGTVPSSSQETSAADTTQETPATQSQNSSPSAPIPLQSSTHRSPDPYLIHPSDSPTAVLVSPPLKGDNYPTWIRGMTKALNAKGKLGFVNGSLPPPSSDPALLDCWKRCDDLVGSWLLNSVHADLRSSCMYADSAQAIWNDLKARFSQSNAPQLYHLKTAIINLKQETLSVTNYYTRLKSLWDEYDSLVPFEACICGTGKSLLERHERDRAMEFLQGLQDRFANLRSQILLIEPLPSTQRIFNLVKQEEAQQLINMAPPTSNEAAALQVNRGYVHRSNGTTNNKRQRPYCDHCSKYGHTRHTCYQIHDFPTSKNKGQSSPSSSIVAAAASNESMPPPMLPSLSADQYSRLMAMLAADENDTPPLQVILY
ncbi:hypothetical protein ACHQM5_011341 [Ranunculus cassubicifolius]